MRPPSAAELLDLWEAGLQDSPIDRALNVLVAACPDKSREFLSALSVGERDSMLLQVRQSLFGRRMNNRTDCPRCAERLEWESDVADFCVGERPDSGAELWVEGDAYRLRFRLPNSSDLASLSGDRQGAADRRTRLLARCLLEASTREGERLPVDGLPEAAWQAMVAEMARADPRANLRIDLSCPACGHHWETPFDVISFLWTEINHWAERTLRTVHLLARAYGWREADILAMSPTRREIYLEMASQ